MIAGFSLLSTTGIPSCPPRDTAFTRRHLPRPDWLGDICSAWIHRHINPWKTSPQPVVPPPNFVGRAYWTHGLDWYQQPSHLVRRTGPPGDESAPCHSFGTCSRLKSGESSTPMSGDPPDSTAPADVGRWRVVYQPQDIQLACQLCCTRETPTSMWSTNKTWSRWSVPRNISCSGSQNSAMR